VAIQELPVIFPTFVNPGGCWNMHSFVEAEGSAATVSVSGGVQVDCEINF